jgi:hypothetical protein
MLLSTNAHRRFYFENFYFLFKPLFIRLVNCTQIGVDLFTSIITEDGLDNLINYTSCYHLS